MNVVHNREAGQFEYRDDGHLARLTYTMDGDVIELIHTEVPEQMAGRGVGGELARAALDHARDKGLRVIPFCPFVRAYIKRHPEYASLQGRR
jgi:uncharacterized protein